ncbi:MAG: YeeE/YedE family protein [Acidobacteria bacterium]|nr:YeeE/YedE family protein [Candidatus Sulfomarinibacter kjeldsenii]
MASTAFWSSLKEEARRNYIAIFEQEWPTWLAGIFLALVALLIFLWKGPWGVAAGYRNLGDWIFYAAGVGGERPPSMWLHPITLTSFGLIIGALVSALMSRQFKVHRASSPAPGSAFATCCGKWSTYRRRASSNTLRATGGSARNRTWAASFSSS